MAAGCGYSSGRGPNTWEGEGGRGGGGTAHQGIIKHHIIASYSIIITVALHHSHLIYIIIFCACMCMPVVFPSTNDAISCFGRHFMHGVDYVKLITHTAVVS